MTDLLDRLRDDRRRRPRADRPTPTSRRTSSTGPAPTPGARWRWSGPARRPRSPRSCARATRTRTPSSRRAATPGSSAAGCPTRSGSQVVLSLGRMRTVRDVDPVAGTITVDAGVVLADVQAAAEAADRLFPMSLGSEGSCTIGGNLATNAGGTAVLRYGMTRELVLGLEVVLPDGRVWDGLRGLRKDNTGYDLTQLFVGSEGTLGVITGAVLRLFPATPRHATAWVAVPSVAAAVSLLGARAAARRRAPVDVRDRQPAGDRPRPRPPARGRRPARRSRATGTSWSSSPGPPPTTGSTTTLESLLGEAVEAGLATDAAIAGSPAQRERAVGAARGHLGGAEGRGRHAQARRHPADRRPRRVDRRDGPGAAGGPARASGR